MHEACLSSFAFYQILILVNRCNMFNFAFRQLLILTRKQLRNHHLLRNPLREVSLLVGYPPQHFSIYSSIIQLVMLLPPNV